MRTPILLPVKYDDHNDTVNDAHGFVVYHCGWPNTMTYEQKKEKGLFLCELLNGNIKINRGDAGFEAIVNTFDPVEVQVNGGEHKRKGNPWGRAGKPK